MGKKSRRGFLAFGMGAAAGIVASTVASREQFKVFILDAIAKYSCSSTEVPHPRIEYTVIRNCPHNSTTIYIGDPVAPPTAWGIR